MKPVVFLGPSLPRNEAEGILGAEYLPPVQQGDLMRVLPFRPPAIGIIDGVFTEVPTVRHREIMWVLSKGIPVFGASSMGALRAAELHDYGMEGVGVIYRWYRRYAMTPDDAVAVTHAPHELGSRPVSDALFDIRVTLRKARRQGVIDREHERKLVETAEAQMFPKRKLMQLVVDSGDAKLIGFVKSRHRSQKAADATTLLKRMSEYDHSGTWPVVDRPPPAVVHAWLDDLAASGLGADFG
ncbi:TfuA-like protein [Amaricoccus tamworthensis]|uniref:TfuA-like protein n=1 Tax=Amaricoccus tamworthensis TaxID=57002 RepID=UPI003C79B497